MNKNNLPEAFLDEMKNLLKEDFNDFYNSYDEEEGHGIRVNTSKISLEKFEEICPFEIEKIPYIYNGYFYDYKKVNPAKYPHYFAGLYYIQEPSAMIPASRLEINEGDRVLDLCASPGGKATELISKLNGTGFLVANDISASRAKILLKNLEIYSKGNFYVTAEEPSKLSSFYKEYFDKILVDAPCSGEGMFRKDSSLIAAFNENGPEYYSEIQKDILEEAVKMLKPGGQLLYSTCTFSVKENEENIKYILDKNNDLSLIRPVWYEGFSEGELGLKNCIRVFPHKMRGEGHFAALIKKNGDLINNSYSEKNNELKINDSLYELPAYEDNGYKKGLRYLRTGNYVGDEILNKKKNKKEIKYSDSYAYTLKPEEYVNCLRFSENDERVYRYLKGETISLKDGENFENGYVLVCFLDYPLGFAKFQGGGNLKNLYNKSKLLM